MIVSNFKELSKEQYEKLSDEEKKRYVNSKILMMNIPKKDKEHSEA